MGPATNQSGSSAALTFPAVTVARDASDLDRYSVAGINNGANIGPFTTISVTVSATIAALQLVEPGFPAIAISTDLPLGTNEALPGNQEHFAQVATFLVSRA